MTMSELIRGKSNHCKWCQYCDNIGNCSKIGRNVGWEITINKEVNSDECPKRKKEED